MSAAHIPRRMTVEEFIDFELESPEPHLYYEGEVYNMSGATSTHARINGNAISELVLKLSDTACGVFTADLFVMVDQPRMITHPDITVICGPEMFSSSKNIAITNPKAIVEVLSPSTAEFDRGRKFEAYLTIPTLDEYILIAQDKYAIDVFTRSTNPQWNFVSYRGLDAEVQLPSLGITLSMAKIYRGVTLIQSSRPIGLE